ncbi:hypothetical protein AGMMS4956_12360 [Bacteroidia bacterium]|nr:hypothetical protein AGMMS4956_12360 [Bacteroidia bacterium]
MQRITLIIIVLLQLMLVETSKAQIVSLKAMETTVNAAQQPTNKVFAGFALKTNVLYWVPVVANIEVEANFGRQWSLCLPIAYSPYTLSPLYSFRLLLLQPEWRWWIKKQQQQGSFLGLHAHSGYFNIAWDDERYQLRDGEKGQPFYGAGLSYGYATMAGNEHIFLEFEIGLGYAHFQYDIFNNTDEGDYRLGERLGYGTRNYWGITRASMAIGYKF